MEKGIEIDYPKDKKMTIPKAVIGDDIKNGRRHLTNKFLCDIMFCSKMKTRIPHYARDLGGGLTRDFS